MAAFPRRQMSIIRIILALLVGLAIGLGYGAITAINPFIYLNLIALMFASVALMIVWFVLIPFRGVPKNLLWLPVGACALYGNWAGWASATAGGLIISPSGILVLANLAFASGLWS